MRYAAYVHCRRCGNLDLQRLSREFGVSRLKFLWKLLRFPVYRCPPCRNRFFSCLPPRPILASPAESGEAEE